MLLLFLSTSLGSDAFAEWQQTAHNLSLESATADKFVTDASVARVSGSWFVSTCKEAVEGWRLPLWTRPDWRCVNALDVSLLIHVQICAKPCSKHYASVTMADTAARSPSCMHRLRVTCYDLFWGAVNSNNFYFLILLFTSLHVSTSTGHPQVKYTQSFLKAITPTTDPFLGYAVHYLIICYVMYYN
jgi:hypothetical protein